MPSFPARNALNTPLDAELTDRKLGPAEARAIGQQEGLIAGVSAVLLAYFGFAAFVFYIDRSFRRARDVQDRIIDVLTWGAEEPEIILALSLMASSLLLFLWLLGGRAGVRILLKDKKATWTLLWMAYVSIVGAIMLGFGIMLAVYGDLTAALSDILRNWDELLQYVAIFLLALFLPLLVAAGIFGRRIRRRGRWNAP